MRKSLILDTDSYKTSHYLQYPPGTVNLFNYLEARGGEFPETVFFGLQYIIKEYLTQRITAKDVLYAEQVLKGHGVPFNKEGWMRIVTEFDGKLPLRIRALPEGLPVPVGTPLLTCEATHPDFAWVVGWFETMIMRVWYPITVATLSRSVKQTIKKYMQETCDNLDGLPFKLHDFGSRGVSSYETAAIGGAAHLVNFQGTDTLAGIEFLREYYGAMMPGFSIPAAEHSTITAWGRENEAAAYENMLKQFAKPGSILAVVSDSYDIYNATEKIWGEQLRQKVIDSGATVVIRPDSGDPVLVVNTLLHTLSRKFGTTTNSKGYKVLNNVRVIQGDGLNPQTIEAILKSAKMAGFSADNIAFGMGGGLLQKVNRDTCKFAYKCSAIAIQEADGSVQWRDVYKDPVTDPGKKSKRGRFGVKHVVDHYELCPVEDPNNLMTVVYENGEQLVERNLLVIRELAK